MKTRHFLDAILQGTGWAHFPARLPSHYWREYSIEWPTDWTTLRDRMRMEVEMRHDLYFCPLLFKNRRRLIPNVQGSSVAFADCDEAPLPFDPEPTILVESSPGRHHAYWMLTAEVSPPRVAGINKHLADLNGFDPGGWDLTQVLRVPGSYNFKYDPAPKVHVVDADLDRVYDPRDFPGTDENVVLLRRGAPVLSEPVYRALVKDARKRLNGRGRHLLRAEPHLVDDRSARIWELEKMLALAGFTALQVYNLVRNTPMARSKYEERTDGELRLWQEANKVVAKYSPDLESS